jgi:outer membrane protein OmpA-like peptidoglycan-associated protein
MTKRRDAGGACVGVTAVCLLLCWVYAALAADDCERAKEVYGQGVQLMNYEERREAFQRAVDACPSYVEAHVNLADALENLGQFEKAEQHYRKAVELRPAYHLPYIGLGEVYLKTGRFALAKEAYEKGLGTAHENERLSDGLKVVEERLRREKSLFTCEQIESCLVDDENFRLMCMCPETHYEYLKRWICIPPIFFSQGSSCLAPAATRQLDEIGKALKSNKLIGEKWLVVGHADNIGDPEYNVQLSKDRATAVTHYLVNRHGLSAESLKMKFFGQVFPRASNNTLGGRSENRRVEIIRDQAQP